MIARRRTFVLVPLLLSFAVPTWAQRARRPAPPAAAAGPSAPGTPLSFRRYQPVVTPFPGTLMRDQLGSGLASLGDVDGNGVVDVALGASADHVRDDCWLGAVWIQFMEAGGSSSAQRKIRPGEGGFLGELDPFDEFGREVAGIGDLDGDGVPDLAVGAPGDDDFQVDAGAVWILFLRADGTVKSHAKILPPIFEVQAFGTQAPQADIRVRDFGLGLAGLGDIDGDGTRELAVGATHGNLPIEGSGAVWILSLLDDGSVLRSSKISAADGGFTGNLQTGDDFGYTLGSASDLDGNGVVDLLVGAPGDDDLREDAGALWRLSIDETGSVVAERKISSITGGGPILSNRERFGEAAAEIGDLDNDGVPDLAVGAPGGDDLWILFLNADGSARSLRSHIAPLTPNYPELEHTGFAGSIAPLGDIDGNNIPELLVAAPGEHELSHGSVWRFDLRRDGRLRGSQEYGLENWTAPAFVTFGFGFGDRLGAAVVSLGDRDGDGGPELLVGQPNDDAVWNVHLDANLAISRVEKWSRATGFPAGLFIRDLFGASIAVLGDVDGNGFDDVAVGAPGDEDVVAFPDGQFQYGAVWILFYGPGGTVIDVSKISEVEGNLSATLTQEVQFGSAIAALGDLDGDGIPDMAVGAPGRTSTMSSGSVFVLFLNADGTVKVETRFFSFNGVSNQYRFGTALAYLGEGRLAITEPFFGLGRIHMAKLGPDGLPAAHFEISPEQGGLGDSIEAGDLFGYSLARVGDLDGDGLDEIALGIPGEHTPEQGSSRGGYVRILFLDATMNLRLALPIGPEHPVIDMTSDRFGWSLGACGDLDGDGLPDLLVGTVDDHHFPLACEESMGSFGILTLGGIASARAGGMAPPDVPTSPTRLR